MEIKVNEYSNGVKSLGFKAGSVNCTVGVLPPGKQYDFGIAKEKETLKIVQGTLAAKGENFSALSDDPLVFEKGEQIKCWCKDVVIYICTHGE